MLGLISKLVLESLSIAIQGLLETCARPSRVISQDFERFPVSDGFCGEYQISQLSCGLFLAGRVEARVKTVRVVLADCYQSLWLPALL
jgi:hypothetical protein